MEPLGELDVVHVDAHTDFVDELDGACLTGASQLRRLAELPLVGTVTALGVRDVERVEVDGMRELGGAGRLASTCPSAAPAKWFARPSRRQRRCRSRSTSTRSTPRSHPGTRYRSRAGSATGCCGRS